MSVRRLPKSVGIAALAVTLAASAGIAVAAANAGAHDDTGMPVAADQSVAHPPLRPTGKPVKPTAHPTARPTATPTTTAGAPSTGPAVSPTASAEPTDPAGSPTDPGDSPTDPAEPTTPAPDADAAQVIGPDHVWKYYFADGYDRAALTDPANDTNTYRTGAQPIGYGSDLNATTLTVGETRPYTAYFTTSFPTPADPWAWKELKLTFAADDGAAVHLNGSEVARVNMPAGDLTDTTRAIEAPRTKTARATPTVLVVPMSGLSLDGSDNVLTVEVHANYRATRDLSLQLTADLVPDPERVGVPTGSAWFYRYDTVSVPPSDWASTCDLGNDGIQGPGPFGFGTPVIRDLDVGVTSERPRTAYFCLQRAVGADADAFGDLQITTWANDGIVVYVDGKEVKRVNMPAGTITDATRATAAPSQAKAEASPVTVTVPRSDFGQDGTVVIAAEVHLNYQETKDMYFDLTAASTGSAQAR